MLTQERCTSGVSKFIRHKEVRIVAKQGHQSKKWNRHQKFLLDNKVASKEIAQTGNEKQYNTGAAQKPEIHRPIERD